MYYKKRQLKSHLMLITIVGLLIGTIAFRITYTEVFLASRPKHTVVIDVGHGGFDPGKVSKDNLLEKNINLAIALKLKDYLEAQDCIVYMTRDSDIDLSDSSGGTKKQTDMRNRISIIENAHPDLMISIHQNSYPSESVHGAQAFYYHSSDSSEYLAKCVQDSLISIADPDNTRTEKSNSSYYILKKTSCPSIIVECGFLSSPTESALLSSDSYQHKLAYAISTGIRTYLNTDE